MTERIELLDLSKSFEGLANPIRLLLLETLSRVREARVSELAIACRISQPHVSWHLRLLRRAGLVVTRRDGREVLCRIDRSAIDQMFQQLNQVVLHPTETPATTP